MIDTQAIRTKILDLAMRGKLTEQKSSEEVDFQDVVTTSTPFILPHNWKWVRIGSIITKDVGGGTPSKSEDEYWKNGTIPWMSVKDFSSAKNGILEDTIDHITQSGLENSSSNLVDTNAIIICMRMALGKIVKLKQPMAINQDLRAIWLNPCVESNFFVFYYSTLKVEGHGMTVAGIKKKQLMEFLMPLPPLAEQQRIVEKIDKAFSVLDTIDALQAQYANNLTTLKAKLIDAAIQGKLTEQLPEDGTAEELYQQIQTEKQALIKAGKIKKEKPLPEITEDEIPFNIPKNWKWIRLRDFGAFSGGKTPSMRHKGYWENGVVSWITSKDMKQKYIASSEMLISEIAAKEMAIHPEKTVLFVVRSGILRRMFPVAILTESGTINQDLKALELYIPDMCEYVYYVLKGFEHTILFKYTKDGTTVNNIIFDALLTMPVPLPPVAEQKRIAERLDLLMSTIEQ